MIKIGITGGIGSGKSYVSHLLEEELRIPVYNADVEARRLTTTDVDIRRGLTDLLGEEVYAADGSLCKPLLANYLFASADHAARVNAIIHPRVKADFVRWTENQSAELVGMESAILLEAGFRDVVDIVLMVYAPVELRLQRAMTRDAASAEQIKARMAAQMDDEEKRRLADFTVVNDGSMPLLPQLKEMFAALQADDK